MGYFHLASEEKQSVPEKDILTLLCISLLKIDQKGTQLILPKSYLRSPLAVPDSVCQQLSTVRDQEAEVYDATHREEAKVHSRAC